MKPTHENCTTLHLLLERQLDGDPLSEAEIAFLDKHVADCEECRAYQEATRIALASLRDLEEMPVPEDLTDRIMARIQEAPAKPVSILRVKWLIPIGIAAVVAAVVMAAPLLNPVTPKSPGTPVVAEIPETLPSQTPRTITTVQPPSVKNPAGVHSKTAPETSPTSKATPTRSTTTPPRRKPRMPRMVIAQGSKPTQAERPEQPPVKVAGQPPETTAENPEVNHELIADANIDPTPFPFLASTTESSQDPLSQLIPPDEADTRTQQSDASDLQFDSMSSLVGF